MPYISDQEYARLKSLEGGAAQQLANGANAPAHLQRWGQQDQSGQATASQMIGGEAVAAQPGQEAAHANLESQMRQRASVGDYAGAEQLRAQLATLGRDTNEAEARARAGIAAPPTAVQMATQNAQWGMEARHTGPAQPAQALQRAAQAPAQQQAVQQQAVQQQAAQRPAQPSPVARNYDNVLGAAERSQQAGQAPSAQQAGRSYGDQLGAAPDAATQENQRREDEQRKRDQGMIGGG